MSTTFDVFPGKGAIPTFAAVLDESTRALHEFLASFKIPATPRITVTLRQNSDGRVHALDLAAPARWPEDCHAWFQVEGVSGGTDAYFWQMDPSKREDELSDLMSFPRARAKQDLIMRCLQSEHYWHFRRSVGQPPAVSLAYGIIAAVFARLTDGILSSSDGAWDGERFPATADEFLSWYFIPDKALDSGHREWASRCIAKLAKEDDSPPILLDVHRGLSQVSMRRRNMDDGKRFPFVLVTFAGIALAGLATRLLSVPWDSGGCFFQVWVSGVTLAFLAAGLPRLKRPQRLLAGGLLLPLGGFVTFGSVYFAPQALFPFLLVGMACAGALWMSSQGKRIPALLLGLLVLSLCAYGVYGIGHMMLVSRLRGLRGNEVSELRFTPPADDSKTFAVRESTAVNEIVESLRETSPYSPQREEIADPWQLRIDLTDGTPISFSLGKGNRAHPHTAWIQFGVEVYQNPSLYRTLEGQGIWLWSNGELGRAQEEMPNKPDGGDG